MATQSRVRTHLHEFPVLNAWNGAAAVRTLTADVTLEWQDSARVQICDPSDGDYTINIPKAVAALEGLGYLIRHSGSANTLTVASPDGTVVVLAAGDWAEVLSVAGAWVAVITLVAPAATTTYYGETKAFTHALGDTVIDVWKIPLGATLTDIRVRATTSPTAGTVAFSKDSDLDAPGAGLDQLAAGPYDPTALTAHTEATLAADLAGGAGDLLYGEEDYLSVTVAGLGMVSLEHALYITPIWSV